LTLPFLSRVRLTPYLRIIIPNEDIPTTNGDASCGHKLFTT